MKLNFNSETASIKASSGLSYNGWNDIVGRKLNEMANSALSSAKSEIIDAMSEVEKIECDPESDLEWIEDRLDDLN